MRVVFISAVGVMLSTAAAVAAPVATVSTVTGSVLVDSGAGFVPVGGVTSVADGHRVLVGQRSGAVLAYGDGCKLKLSAASITTVSSKQGCQPVSQVAGADLTPDQIMQPQQQIVPPPQGFPWLPVGVATGLGGVFGYLIADPKGTTQYIYVPISP